MIGVMMLLCVFFFFKQKTAYEIVSRDWSSDVCSSDLGVPQLFVNCRTNANYSVLGLKKCSGVYVSMAKMTNFMIIMMLFPVFRTENAAK